MSDQPTAEQLGKVGDMWDITRFDMVKEIALDDQAFSSDVSRFLQVPNGMDGEAHDAYRALIDRYLTRERVDEQAEGMRDVAREVIEGFLNHSGAAATQVDAVYLGALYAVRGAIRWLGWHPESEGELLDWVQANWHAKRAGDPEGNRQVADWFNNIVQRELARHRQEQLDDVTTELINDETLGRPLTDEELVSILRNWTGGDLGSMTLAVGVVMAGLADIPDLQQFMREGQADEDWALVIDEFLRINDPFIGSRRVVTRDTEVGGHSFKAGERVILNWAEANRDPAVFGDPLAFDPERNYKDNLVYGVGRHVCPGRYLSTVELKVFAEEALAATAEITPDFGAQRIASTPPMGGFASVPLLFVR